MSYHDRAVKLRNDAVRKRKDELRRLYKYIDLSHFKILAPIHDDKHGNPHVSGVDVYYKDMRFRY